MTALPEHFFRREYAGLVAALTRRAGAHHLAEAEDAAQAALLTALERWPHTGLPDNPSTWLRRVALNKLVDGFRARGRRAALDALPAIPETYPPEGALAGEMRDEMLRMLFLCCDARVPADSQVALALKTLCGFDVREVAERLFTTEANVYRRLSRARARLQEGGGLPEALEPGEYAARLGRVHEVLYLLFTEGYLSSHADLAIRAELCDEALRLAEMLAEHPVGRTPATAALVALFHLHRARLSSRVDAAGLVLLAEQDRTAWDARRIERGLWWLAESASGEGLSRYHLEAGIAAEHCLAPSVRETRWRRIAESYALLERVAPSPLHRLNRALAVAEDQGPDAGLALLAGFAPPGWLEGSYLWSAVLADLHLRAGDAEVAERHRRAALAGAPSDAVRASLARRLAAR
ncbi:MAG: sigma-70 family RNA polymerase sigma factor [Alphaproteobacteria bacterium]|nr:sigma-70 family RNA polymerase sigma factor [Alphaproteobacteria bacterium]